MHFLFIELLSVSTTTTLKQKTSNPTTNFFSTPNKSSSAIFLGGKILTTSFAVEDKLWILNTNALCANLSLSN